MPPPDEVLSVAIVGGGFTGAAVAFNHARSHTDEAARNSVEEPRAHHGGGQAK